MLKRTKLIAALMLLLIPNIYSQSDTNSIQIAKESVFWMQNGQEQNLRNFFTKEVSSKLDLKTIKSIWSQLISQYGDYKSTDTVYTSVYKDNVIVTSVLDFKNGKLNYNLTFNKDNKIAGIFFRPYSVKKKEFAAEETIVFKEKKLNFENENINFPAMLCLPKNNLKAIIVFVHGSGPNDMDETIGANKIFKQLAHELAKYGIGSLRYHKRSFLIKQGEITKNFPLDLQHIVVTDAIAAVNFVSNLEECQSSPIFVVGHSLGAFAAPIIAKQNSKVRGIVLMAGNSRPLEDLIVDQYKYLYSRGGLSKAEKTEIKKIKKQVKNVKTLRKDLDNKKIKKLPLVNDTNFWLSLNSYNPVETANSLSIPMLILHGNRDYQVPFEDFKIWRNKTNKLSATYYRNKNDKTPIYYSQKPVTLISYFGLNHLFIFGEDKSYPEEYNHQGNVSKLMISDMANWITQYSTNSY